MSRRGRKPKPTGSSYSAVVVGKEMVAVVNHTDDGPTVERRAGLELLTPAQKEQAAECLRQILRGSWTNDECYESLFPREK